MQMTSDERLDHLEEQLNNIEKMLGILVDRQQIRDWYTTAEAAKLLGKAEFTVREWCRLKRVRSERRRSGRGAFLAYVISQEEIARFQREGLLPLPSSN
jgi:hypothetical protein